MKLNYREDSHLYGWSGSFGRNSIFTITIFSLGLSFYFQDHALGTDFADISATDHIGYMLRVTARIAFFLLLLAMIARPFRQLTGMGFELLRHRRYLGLAMSFVSTVHFFYVVAYLQISAEPLKMTTIIFGGFAFLLTWILAATSNDSSQRMLGVWWRRIHVFSSYYIWLIFMVAFFGTLRENSEPLYAGIVSTGLVAVSLRIAVHHSQRFKRTA